MAKNVLKALARVNDETLEYAPEWLKRLREAYLKKLALKQSK
jgi:hypothetical protein